MNESKYVIGLDLGGTESKAVIIAESGRVLGLGKGGPGNSNFSSVEEVTSSVRDALKGAAHLAGHPSNRAACLAICTEPSTREISPVFKEFVAQEDIIQINEGDAALVGGLFQQTGVSLICGTGSVGWGRNSDGDTSLTSSWGTIGDEGSAFEIGRAGLNAAFKNWDNRGPETHITQMLLEKFSTDDLRTICTPIYTARYPRMFVASMAKEVVACASSGDGVSKAILEGAAHDAAHIASACAKALGFCSAPYAVVGAGGMILSEDRLYFNLIAKALRNKGDAATLVFPKAPPVIGCGLLALQRIGCEWDRTLLALLLKSYKSIADQFTGVFTLWSPSNKKPLS